MKLIACPGALLSWRAAYFGASWGDFGSGIGLNDMTPLIGGLETRIGWGEVLPLRRPPTGAGNVPRFWHEVLYFLYLFLFLTLDRLTRFENVFSLFLSFGYEGFCGGNLSLASMKRTRKELHVTKCLETKLCPRYEWRPKST